MSLIRHFYLKIRLRRVEAKLLSLYCILSSLSVRELNGFFKISSSNCEKYRDRLTGKQQIPPPPEEKIKQVKLVHRRNCNVCDMALLILSCCIIIVHLAQGFRFMLVNTSINPLLALIPITSMTDVYDFAMTMILYYPCS